MRSVIPWPVRLPDGRVALLVAYHGLLGCVQSGSARILETVPLISLDFHDPRADSVTYAR